MKETLEELKKAFINDTIPAFTELGSPTKDYYTKDTVLKLIDTAYNLGKAESTSEAVKQERERFNKVINYHNEGCQYLIEDFSGETSDTYDDEQIDFFETIIHNMNIVRELYNLPDNELEKKIAEQKKEMPLKYSRKGYVEKMRKDFAKAERERIMGIFEEVCGTIIKEKYETTDIVRRSIASHKIDALVNFKDLLFFH